MPFDFDLVGIDLVLLNFVFCLGPYVRQSLGVEAYQVALNLLVDDTNKLKKVIQKLARKIGQQKAVIARYEDFDRRLGF